MGTKTISKNVPITVDGIYASYDVHKVENGYTFDVTLGRGFSRLHAARGFFERPTVGAVGVKAAEMVEAALRVIIAKSYEEAIYVVISDMPGFGEKRLGAHVRAGYDGMAAGGPRYVVKTRTPEQAEKIVARVAEIGVIVDGDRTFSPKVVDTTNHALAALGSTYGANDATTYLAALRAEDAEING
jgi:hypothetical protein